MRVLRGIKCVSSSVNRHCDTRRCGNFFGTRESICVSTTCIVFCPIDHSTQPVFVICTLKADDAWPKWPAESANI